MWGKLILALILWKAKYGERLFREWVEQEERKEKIIQAVANNSDEFPNHLLEYVATALRVPTGWIENLPWRLTIRAFHSSLQYYPKIDLPISRPSKEHPSEEDWDYSGRTWHLYSHLLASHYGWTLEYISQLQVVEALAKIQEILTEEQLEREFQHSLSELAYSYDKHTGKSTYVSLPRPPWMQKRIKEVQRIRIPASAMPMGVVNYDALPEELRPKEIVH